MTTKVKSVEVMDLDTFIKHFNNRHLPIGEFKEISHHGMTEYVVRVFHKFHEREHMTNPGEFDHEHEKHTKKRIPPKPKHLR